MKLAAIRSGTYVMTKTVLMGSLVIFSGYFILVDPYSRRSLNFLWIMFRAPCLPSLQDHLSTPCAELAIFEFEARAVWVAMLFQR